MNGSAGAGVACSLTRRSLVISYDSVVVVALWFAATAILLPIAGVQAIEPGQQFYFLYPPYLALVNWLYLAISWRYGNQTLGMRAWRVYLYCGGDNRLSWQNAALRYLVAVAGFAMVGVGFISGLLHSGGLTWHDRASRSWLIFKGVRFN